MKTAEDIAEMTRQIRETGFDTPWYLYAVLASTQRKTTPPHTVRLFERHRREMAKALTKAAPSPVAAPNIVEEDFTLSLLT